jgi:hypothetical protein
MARTKKRTAPGRRIGAPGGGHPGRIGRPLARAVPVSFGKQEA